MGLQFRNPLSRAANDTGFSNLSNAEGRRLVRRDGSTNVQKTGMPWWQRKSIYHILIRMPTWEFLLAVFVFYVVVNTIFALLYLIVGIENIRGVEGNTDNILSNFLQCFFMSSQTMTTVGYGHLNPSGLAANIIASIESFCGLLIFAMFSGLLYGRFSRPRAYLKFSDNVLVTPHKGYNALMVRVAGYKNNHLTDVEAQMTIAIHVKDENGEDRTRFYRLDLELSKITSLALSWTIVHIIDENSPLYEMSFEDFKSNDIEIMYHIKGFDDNFSNIVQQRTSYTVEEVIYGAKFKPVFHQSEDGSATVLELDKLNDHEILKPESNIEGQNT